MGRRGSKPLPQSILELRGSRRANGRATNLKWLKPLATVPDPPDWLDDVGKAAWCEVLTHLVPLAYITPADLQCLAVYCDTWARWKRARDFVAEHGYAYKQFADDGTLLDVKRWPEAIELRMLTTLVQRYQAELGLTPDSRQRLGIYPSESSNDLDDFDAFIRGDDHLASSYRPTEAPDSAWDLQPHISKVQ